MSAVVEAATHFPTIDAAIDISLEAPPTIDVEITVYGGFDPATDELIHNARKAAEILEKEYGIYAIVIPRTLYWSIGPSIATPYTMPLLVINGKEVASGFVPAPQEIVREALALLGTYDEEKLPLLAPQGRSENRQAATATW